MVTLFQILVIGSSSLGVLILTRYAAHAASIKVTGRTDRLYLCTSRRVTETRICSFGASMLVVSTIERPSCVRRGTRSGHMVPGAQGWEIGLERGWHPWSVIGAAASYCETKAILRTMRKAHYVIPKPQ